MFSGSKVLNLNKEINKKDRVRLLSMAIGIATIFIQCDF